MITLMQMASWMDLHNTEKIYVHNINVKEKRLVINWPLWQEGGMQVDVATQRMDGKNLG